MIYIGLDDTDILNTRGTGHLARIIAGELASMVHVVGVTRHQLLKDPRVPCTSKNSSATIHVEAPEDVSIDEIAGRVREVMMANFIEGSDPGLCVVDDVPPAVVEFGWRAKRELIQQSEAWELAQATGIRLMGLGGTRDGVIGALAAVGLAASGNDGRYVIVGRSRELSGLQPVSALLEAGVRGVQSVDGQMVTSGLVMADKLRPARRNGNAIAIVRWADGFWEPLKLD
ncbi:MAG TPA: hypothetical protein PK801_16580 [Aggregatilineales bacterium]|jgi:tRNA(Ile2) C34 agmatinyltransferase TiaS|nr:ABC transporter substrate-binding protein [Chloroflexota bacterium]HOA23868.1 hypothetical protein [Aggregatilineales bacterium]HPV06876.1 hypothetical protein [Aggregatilineales bacterium]HQA69944.1 hypothetical protein [Aggregatilineales bacterium]HQE18432.1 hypothetical protein [Aggregatilineales bacterium]